MQENQAIVGRPTLFITFAGPHDAEQIVSALTGLGISADDITALRRPKGTDAVVDAITGERAPGQSGDASKLDQTDSDTILILHPEDNQVDAIRNALTPLGASDFQFEGQTVYTGAQSEQDVEDEAAEALQNLKAETAAIESAQAETSVNTTSDSNSLSGSADDTSEEVATSAGASATDYATEEEAKAGLRERIDTVQQQITGIKEDLDDQKK